MINGQKVWTSFAQFSHRCILLTRTGDASTPNHEGSRPFSSTSTPRHHGAAVCTPCTTSTKFCEVYFDDVVVDGSRMLGQPGDGWRLAMDLLPYERSTCFWQRIAYLYSGFDALVGEAADQGAAIDNQLGEVYLALHTCAADRGPRTGWLPGTSSGRTPRSTRCWAGAEHRSTTPHGTCCPASSNSKTVRGAPNTTCSSRAATIYGGTAEVQRNIIARRLLDLGKE